ncbi:hypothetical protein JCGZ_09149 [Jatropha curcas]|uniref:Uncharacterized protein n=1 Tax=Jatropha curcas TaxID=180498 RepID=A0A067KF57_JATCU|nr:hypothetical protein JCGZ_09149 [Jatropha curcas]
MSGLLCLSTTFACIASSTIAASAINIPIPAIFSTPPVPPSPPPPPPYLHYRTANSKSKKGTVIVIFIIIDFDCILSHRSDDTGGAFFVKFSEILDKGLLPDVFTYNALISGGDRKKYSEILLDQLFEA